MNNTTFPFKKKQIVQSVLEPDTHNIWLNPKDNKLYQYNDGWEPIGGNNIYRIYLMAHPSVPGRLVLDPKYDKENTLARRAFNEDYNTSTNNIYLITLSDGNYGELTGVANCYSNEYLITDFTVGIYQDPKTLEYRLSRMVINIDSEIFRDLSNSNTDISFRMHHVAIQATPIR